jgi:hypothetical protein
MILQPVKSVPEKPAISAAPLYQSRIIIMNFAYKTKSPNLLSFVWIAAAYLQQLPK